MLNCQNSTTLNDCSTDNHHSYTFYRPKNVCIHPPTKIVIENQEKADIALENVNVNSVDLTIFSPAKINIKNSEFKFSKILLKTSSKNSLVFISGCRFEKTKNLFLTGQYKTIKITNSVFNDVDEGINIQKYYDFSKFEASKTNAFNEKSNSLDYFLLNDPITLKRSNDFDSPHFVRVIVPNKQFYTFDHTLLFKTFFYFNEIFEKSIIPLMVYPKRDSGKKQSQSI